MKLKLFTPGQRHDKFLAEIEIPEELGIIIFRRLRTVGQYFLNTSVEQTKPVLIRPRKLDEKAELDLLTLLNYGVNVFGISSDIYRLINEGVMK
jgi:hypothetical protein